MEVKMAKSKAGHDKDQIYVIVREERDFVYLADGVYRTVGQPKRKNRKHIQIIRNIPPKAAELLMQNDAWGDLEIKRALKMYQEEQNVKSRCN